MPAAVEVGESGVACRHNQCCRALLIDALDSQFDQLVGGEISQVLARNDAVLGQFVSQLFVHRLDFEQIISRLVLVDSFLDRAVEVLLAVE